MKSAEYVGSVVAAYRYVIDHYKEDKKGAIATGKRILSSDFARSKTTYWYGFKNELEGVENAGALIVFVLFRNLESVRIKSTREWKEEVVFSEGRDRRAELCDILFVKRRADVAAAFHALVHGWIFGPGGKPPSAGGRLGLKDVLREIALSGEYARGSVTGGFPARRIDAEVLDDAICSLGEAKRNYQSPAPEPFSFLPGDRRTGKSAVTAKQRLYLFNSGRLHNLLGRVVMPGGWKNNPLSKLPLPKRVDDLYWRVLGREPTKEERRHVMGLWKRRGGGKKKGAKPFDLLRDVAWCLFNTKEFLYRV